MLRFAYPYLLFLIPAILVISWYRWRFHQSPTYIYPVASWLFSRMPAAQRTLHITLFALRTLSLLTLCILVARPQLVDVKSKVQVQGIDIMLVLDVSGSMAAFDDTQTRQRRIDCAKQEALRFIEKRSNDQLGLVIFGLVAVSRCPLTLDATILKELVSSLDISVIDPRGTVLAKALLVGAARFAQSQAKSKIMILLTDGTPSPEDMPAQQALDVVKQMGIKVYTIGIGDESGGYMEHPQFGLIPCGAEYNPALLQHIAQNTGGQFFEAKNARDLHLIYDQIDRLEKTEYDAPIFSTYYDFFFPFVTGACVLLLLEAAIRSWWVLL